MLMVTFPSKTSGTAFDSPLRHQKLATRASYKTLLYQVGGTILERLTTYVLL